MNMQMMQYLPHIVWFYVGVFVGLWIAKLFEDVEGDGNEP